MTGIRPNRSRAAVVGAGIGGLVSAVELARRGLEVHIFERSSDVGGKMRRVRVGDAEIDAGPTVFTMRWILEQVFADAGRALDDRLEFDEVSCIARHTWAGDGVFDLYTDRERSAESIRAFFGPREAKGYRRFCDYTETIFKEVKEPFLLAQRPGMMDLMAAQGLRALKAATRIDPFRTMMTALGDYFKDPRLLQLFGRYATYSGSSPFHAPATLSLIAHVEREGVWVVRGGMHRLAQELANLAAELGAQFHFERPVSRIMSDGRKATGVELADGERFETQTVVANLEARALMDGLLGDAVSGRRAVEDKTGPSQSAVTWNLLAETDGFPLAHHAVFFSGDYPQEFRDIEAGQLPAEPTVYICAQDRDDLGLRPVNGRERMLILVNAPAWGERDATEELDQCQERTFRFLEKCGLRIAKSPELTVRTSPSDFARAFPGSQGSLYGGASHGWKAFFNRPAARTKVPGLYLTGASAHPGAGVPMVALSGRLAAQAAAEDLDLTSTSRPTATPGGMSMRSRSAAGTA
ncbi:MAG: 1-hydroxycarotenoid 3,4-desaturase CrtD [Myxococcota bacterium]